MPRKTKPKEMHETLLEQVAAAFADEASDEIRAQARQALQLLGAALGEPGTTVTTEAARSPTTAPTTGPDVLDLLIGKLSSYLTESQRDALQARTKGSEFEIPFVGIPDAIR